MLTFFWKINESDSNLNYNKIQKINNNYYFMFFSLVCDVKFPEKLRLKTAKQHKMQEQSWVLTTGLFWVILKNMTLYGLFVCLFVFKGIITLNN